MLKVGLTGSIGSGKSTIAGVFKVLGIPVYTADDEAKKILDLPEVVQLIVTEFGAGLLTEEGKIHRQMLAAIVFNNANSLAKLNSIIHPRVKKHFTDWMSNQTDTPYLIQEAAIIYESGFDVFFDKMIVVAAPAEERIARVVKRDVMARDQVLLRMDKQWNEALKLKKADFVIHNGENDMAIQQVLAIHKKLIDLNENLT